MRERGVTGAIVDGTGIFRPSEGRGGAGGAGGGIDKSTGDGVFWDMESASSAGMWGSVALSKGEDSNTGERTGAARDRVRREGPGIPAVGGRETVFFMTGCKRGDCFLRAWLISSADERRLTPF